MIVGFAVVLAMAVALVTDASAAYLQRQGLDTLADGAALRGADLGATGEETYPHGVPPDRLALTAAAARASVRAYLVDVGRLPALPGPDLDVSVDGAAEQRHRARPGAARPAADRSGLPGARQHRGHRLAVVAARPLTARTRRDPPPDPRPDRLSGRDTGSRRRTRRWVQRNVTADLTYLLAGGCLLLAVLLPQLLRRWAVSAPMVLVGVGMLVGLTPLPDGLPLDPQANRAIDRARHRADRAGGADGRGPRPGPTAALFNRRPWGGWSPTWRLLAIAMPLCIASVALIGWWASAWRPPPRSCSARSSRRPTRCWPPTSRWRGPSGIGQDDHEVDETDEVRFTLTSEAGLNDGLAFPFVYAAILLATEGAASGWALEWVGFYLVGKVLIGVLAGLAVGWLLGKLAFRSRHEALLGWPRPATRCWPWPPWSCRTAWARWWAATGSCPSSSVR